MWILDLGLDRVADGNETFCAKRKSNKWHTTGAEAKYLNLTLLHYLQFSKVRL
jgi:hypothetical protein